MITKQLIDQIEGEANVYFDLDAQNKVIFSTVSFPHFRGMEKILEGKNGLDALVITPRVCGICGHAHLLATVRALEDAYKNSGYNIDLNQKIISIREFTLVMEMIQNHFKWIYFTILPQLEKFSTTHNESQRLKGAFASSIAAKAIALFGGQWPHSSYMLPGGVTCDPTFVELIQSKNYLQELRTFFEKECLGCSVDTFLSFESCKDFNTISSDIARIEAMLIENSFHTKGFSADRFMILGEHKFISPVKLKHTRSFKNDVKFVELAAAYAPHETTYAKNALYKGEYYEVGSLGRMIAQNETLIKNIHRRYKDSAYSRVIARIYELGYLLEHAKELLENIDITKPSCINVEKIEKITAQGIGIVEAPRGPLIHNITLEKGIIKKFEIITPTQWNIGSSTLEKPTPVQHAMVGHTKKDALFIFRSFDVCSVCTTH